MQKQPARLWISVVFLGWLFDYLFFKHTPGVSFLVFITAALLIGFILLKLDNIRISTRSLILIPLILFFAVMTFLRMEPLTVVLSVGFTLFLTAGLVVSFTGGQFYRYGFVDYLSRGLDLFRSAMSGFFLFAMETRRNNSEPDQTARKGRNFWPVVRGLALAIPVVTFFAAMLASADKIYSIRVNELINLFRMENLPEVVFRVCYSLVLAYFFGGIILHAAKRSGDEKLFGLDKPFISPFCGFTEACMILGSVVLLFTSFVIVQFQYFFGGQNNISQAGFTYAEYARNGFGELAGVAFFALLLYLGLTSLTSRNSPQRKSIFSVLGVMLLVLVGVILVSAYQRINLYENAYGFTRLRTYTHVFMIWIAVLLAIVVSLDLIQGQRYFIFAALISILGFAVTISLLNVDAFIFQKNFSRYEEGKVFDVGYLASLSTDLVPAIVTKFEQSTAGSKAQERLGAVLACVKNYNFSDPGDQSWQAFHMSNYLAQSSLHLIDKELLKYKIDKSEWPVKI
ncbi:MAG: DUF4173 domain-containing protein, partial [Chloroflexota bacterium]